MMTPSEMVKSIRAEHNINQAEIAVLLDVSPNSVSAWERGLSVPKDDNLIKLTELFSESNQDMVNSPSHYQVGGIETIDILQSILSPEEFRGFLKGNIIKYRERAGKKGDPEEDYKKARWYYDKLQEVENNEGK